MKEVWKDVIGYKGLYSVSNLGNIRRNSILKPFKSNSGYLIVSLSKHGKTRKYLVHNLVAQNFVGKRPNGLQINHKDCNKKNNKAMNLEYVTSKENKQHAIKHNLMPRGVKQGLSKLREHEIRQIRYLYREGFENTYTLAKRFNVSNVSISNIINRKTWKHI